MQRRDVLRWGTAAAATVGSSVTCARGARGRSNPEERTTDRRSTAGQRSRTAGDGRVAWTVALSGDEPSFLGTEDACFVADASGLTAYDPSDGESTWETGVPRYPYAVNGDGLIVLDGGLAELDAASGEDRWRVDLPRRAFGFTVDDDRVYYATREGSVVAIDRDSGAQAWRETVEGDAFVFTLAVADGLLAGGTEGGVVGFEAASGKQRWVNRDAVTASTVTERAVFVGTDESDPGAGVERLDRATGERVWRYEVDTAYHNGLGTYGTHRFGERLFVTYNGEVMRVDPATGDEVWRAPIDRGFVGTHFVEGVVDGALVVQIQGELTAIDVESGDVRWALELADVRGIHRNGFLDVEFAAGSVFATDRDGVQAIDPADGRERWTLELGERTIDTTSGEMGIAHPIAVAGERVVASQGERLLGMRANVAPTVEIQAPTAIEPDVEVTLAVHVEDPEAEYAADSERESTDDQATTTASTTTASTTTSDPEDEGVRATVPAGVEVEWSVDGEVAGSGATLDRAFARGEHTVSATATDHVGASTTAEATILVGGPVTTTTTSAPTSTEPETDDNASGSPGFGALTGFAGILAAGYAVARRRIDR